MKIEEDGTAVFKSTPYYFKEERDGLKPNTVRLLTRDEKREIETTVRVNKIRIECIRANVNDACFDPFTRTLTSIEQIGELCGYYLFVFSWRHEGQSQFSFQRYSRKRIWYQSPIPVPIDGTSMQDERIQTNK